MAGVEKVSVALTQEMAAEMRHVVETGEYASASEVMRDALREWRQRRADRAQAVQELGRQWDIGMASGPATDGEAAYARMRARLDSKLADRTAE